MDSLAWTNSSNPIIDLLPAILRLLISVYCTEKKLTAYAYLTVEYFLKNPFYNNLKDISH